MQGDKMKLLIDGKDETKRAGSFVRSDNVDGLAMSFSFDIAINEIDKYWPKAEIKTGDKVAFFNDAGKAVFSGMITDISQNDQYCKSFTAYDYGWNLNKNEVLVQFRNMNADAAIKKLCGDFKIPVGAICSIPTKISKIYPGDLLSDCIRDILKQAEADTAKSYRMEVRENKLFIEAYNDLVIKTTFKPASNLAQFDPTKYPASVGYEESIADLANSIQVTSEEEQSVRVLAKAQDTASIARYGVLQKVEHVTSKDSAQAGNIAKNLLLENNQVKKACNATFLGDDAVRSGRIISYHGKMHLVKSCTHYYKNGMHTMELTLEAV